jgi:hypothetical protein
MPVPMWVDYLIPRKSLLTLVQLAYRLGGKLKELESLHPAYIAEVLTRAERGGYIRWHMLNVENEVISSTMPMDFMNTYYVWVGVKVRSLSQVRPATHVVYHQRDLVQVTWTRNSSAR